MKSLSRALEVLTELSRHGHPRTLTDITNAVGLHKSTVHRMLATFVEFGLVRRDEANRYVVGLGALDLARAARGDAGPDSVVHPALSALHESTGQAVSYGRPRGGHLVRTATAGQPAADPGAPLPMHATALGKAYLAHRPRVEVDRFVARAPFPRLTACTVTDAYGLLRSLARARTCGYAVEDREYAETGRAVAAPVLDHDGLAVAAVAVRVPSRVRHPAELRGLAAAVTACADRIGAGLLDEAPPMTVLAHAQGA
ncbi:IclR family transcriptional regulator [Jiangella alba]|uniref:Glycerol operon regulatory protein n=1 Tax=Jiangella alba TaxID=561176 RepID=A0A1H5PSN9_9ACTN|nr:IclR family transcriptional regulator [Jiangella alba]SEF16796.1 transcriptional regulator, IclR family [Jiangella alba]